MPLCAPSPEPMFSSLTTSRSMVRHAMSQGVRAVVGIGESLPLESATTDLVYFHLSIHHGDWRAMLDEAWRVIRSGGVIWVWTMSDEHHRSSFLAEWFPSVAAIDEERFPPVTDLEEYLKSFGGFPTTVKHCDMVERPARSWIAAVEPGFLSTLHLISQREIEEGLDRFRRAYPNESQRVTYQLRLSGVWSKRP